MRPGDPRTAAAVERFALAVLDRLAGRVALVKPQIAFFERLGWRGFQVLEDVVVKAQDLGLRVLLDAKRGDIGSTAAGYADAYLGPAATIPADAMTLNPYLGLDPGAFPGRLASSIHYEKQRPGNHGPGSRRCRHPCSTRRAADGHAAHYLRTRRSYSVAERPTDRSDACGH